jgi:hypothetical protein
MMFRLSMHRRLCMETKIWDMSLSQQDIETLIGRQILDGEWNIVVDELYNNDVLYDTINKLVYEIARDAIGLE